MAGFDYGKYLASREWALKKEAVRKRSHGWCERCAVGDHQDTHHLTYERIGNELLDDLQALCRPCHEFISGKTNYDPCDDVKVVAMAVNVKSPALKGVMAAIDTGARFVGTPTGITFWPEEVSQLPQWAADDPDCSFGSPIITSPKDKK